MTKIKFKKEGPDMKKFKIELQKDKEKYARIGVDLGKHWRELLASKSSNDDK